MVRFRDEEDFGPTLDAAAAERLGLSATAVEKDYWVSQVLKILSAGFGEDFIFFKGGTSGRWAGDRQTSVLRGRLSGDGRHFYDVYQLLGDAQVRELLADRDQVHEIMASVEEITRQHFRSEEAEVRPEGGFAACLAFDPSSEDSTLLRTGYETTMTDHAHRCARQCRRRPSLISWRRPFGWSGGWLAPPP